MVVEQRSRGALIGGIAGAVLLGVGAAYFESQTNYMATSAHNEYMFFTHLFPTNPQPSEIVLPPALDVALTGVSGGVVGLFGGAITGGLIETFLPGRIRSGGR